MSSTKLDGLLQLCSWIGPVKPFRIVREWGNKKGEILQRWINNAGVENVYQNGRFLLVSKRQAFRLVRYTL